MLELLVLVAVIQRTVCPNPGESIPTGPHSTVPHVAEPSRRGAHNPVHDPTASRPAHANQGRRGQGEQHVTRQKPKTPGGEVRKSRQGWRTIQNPNNLKDLTPQNLKPMELQRPRDRADAMTEFHYPMPYRVKMEPQLRLKCSSAYNALAKMNFVQGDLPAYERYYLRMKKFRTTWGDQLFAEVLWRAGMIHTDPEQIKHISDHQPGLLRYRMAGLPPLQNQYVPQPLKQTVESMVQCLTIIRGAALDDIETVLQQVKTIETILKPFSHLGTQEQICMMAGLLPIHESSIPVRFTDPITRHRQLDMQIQDMGRFREPSREECLKFFQRRKVKFELRTDQSTGLRRPAFIEPVVWWEATKAAVDIRNIFFEGKTKNQDKKDAISDIMSVMDPRSSAFLEVYLEQMIHHVDKAFPYVPKRLAQLSQDQVNLLMYRLDLQKQPISIQRNQQIGQMSQLMTPELKKKYEALQKNFKLIVTQVQNQESKIPFTTQEQQEINEAVEQEVRRHLVQANYYDEQ